MLQAVCKVVFNSALVLSIVTSACACRFLSILKAAKLLSRRTCENLSRVAAGLCFRIGLCFCPHIRVTRTAGSLRWQDIPPHAALCSNHTSTIDIFVYFWLATPRYLWGAKFFYSANIGDMPVLGPVVTAGGQFPVHLTKEAINSDDTFTMDKDKQAAVAADVHAFVRAGGGFALFPEGAINRNPVQLKPFRLGSFATIIEHQMPVFFLVAWGCQKVWPPGAPNQSGIGGNAGTIVYTIGQLPVDYAPRADGTVLTAQALAAQLQQAMQAEVDRLRERYDR